MTAKELIKNIKESTEAILAKSNSKGQVTGENLGDINNDACDIAYYLKQLATLHGDDE